MSKQQKEKNDFELICEFIGFRRQEVGEYNKVSYWKPDPKDKRKRGIFVGYFDNEAYLKDWNFIMSAVTILNIMYAEDRFINFDHDIYLSMRNWVADANIENATQDAITMIKFYNEN